MEIFKWTTEHYHPDNAFTMNEYLENHLPMEAEILYTDGSYAEVELDGTWALDAKGDGDSFNHVIEAVKIG